VAELESMKVYQTKNPVEAFEHDISENRIHFLATLGFAAQIPGVGMITKESCFDSVDVVFIDKTGDTFSEGTMDQIIKLKGGARSYASEYNALLRRHLHKTGATECGPNENWGDAFTELNAYVWGRPTRHGSGLGMHPTSPPEFTISLLDLDLTEDTTEKACEIFHKNGVSQSVQFHLDEHRKYDGEWKRTKIASFTCKNGTRSELKYER